ncbi:MAG: glycosyl hydrolase [Desulfitobacteriaceae bacterium]
MNLEQKLKNPAKEYRGVPFWSWNDELKPDELRRQINEMDKSGLGGYFMHSRPGLKTQYMGEEWMECIEASVDEGKKTGMYSWLYDEFGWPSGFAGGIVTGKGEKYQQKWMECEEAGYDYTTQKGITLGFYVLDEDLKVCKRLNTFNEAKEYIGKKKVVHIFYNINPYYFDILDKEVVREFINSTYEPYYERFKENFGKEIPGIFTDEPQYHRRCVPWSYVLETEFKNSNGYELVDKLPCLYYKLEGYEKVRYDFWKTVNRLYTTAFAKQIGEWCEEHNCSLTGHLMYEDSLTLQMTATAGVMPSYEYMQLPGIDWLDRRIGEDPITVKQVSSVIHQLDKKFFISEMFGCSGWNVSFEELKWIAEWQYVLGVNLMCQHLESYSLKGARKRDYPPSLFYQQSWWKDYNLFNDYFARLGVALTEGTHKANVLVIHPIRSAWIVYNNLDKRETDELNKPLQDVSTYLLNMHMDFDYGDEGLIQKYGSVDSKKLIVGSCKYDVVVLPSVLNLDCSTVNLINEFVDNGGKVIAVGKLPVYCEGMKDSMLEELNKKVILIENNKESLKREIVTYIELSLTIQNNEGEDIKSIYYQQRETDEEQILFMVNTSQEERYEAVVTVKCPGRPYMLILETGNRVEIDNVEYQEDKARMKFTFEPMQSYLVIIDKSEKNTAVIEKNGYTQEETIEMKDEWTANMEDHNALTLDYCQISVDGGEWSEWMPAIVAQEKLLFMGKKVKVGVKYKFDVDLDLSQNKEMAVVIEEAEMFDFIEVNGSRIKYKDEGYWIDISFKKVDIKPYIHAGVNYINMERDFYCKSKPREIFIESLGPRRAEINTEVNKLTFDVEIESIYIIGDFGVKSLSGYTDAPRKAQFTDGPFVIVEKTEKVLSSKSLVEQGMVFYQGRVMLEQDIDLKDIEEGHKIYVELENPRSVISKVHANGNMVDVLCWRPFKVDITSYLKKGTNKIGIELYNSNRNLLGPHHHVVGEKYACRPFNFTTRPAFVESETEETDIWRDRYSFVQFGLCAPAVIKEIT